MFAHPAAPKRVFRATRFFVDFFDGQKSQSQAGSRRSQIEIQSLKSNYEYQK
jgi:hypothetical protein